MYLHWTNDRFISTKISRLSVADILPSINSAHYQKGQSVADYHWLFYVFQTKKKMLFLWMVRKFTPSLMKRTWPKKEVNDPFWYTPLLTPAPTTQILHTKLLIGTTTCPHHSQTKHRMNSPYHSQFLPPNGLLQSLCRYMAEQFLLCVVHTDLRFIASF